MILTALTEDHHNLLMRTLNGVKMVGANITGGVKPEFQAMHEAVIKASTGGLDLSMVPDDVLIREVGKRMAARESETEPSPVGTTPATTVTPPSPREEPSIPPTIPESRPPADPGTELLVDPDGETVVTRVPGCQRCEHEPHDLHADVVGHYRDNPLALNIYSHLPDDPNSVPLELPDELRGVTDEKGWARFTEAGLDVTATKLRELVSNGLPTNVRISVTPDVLAMHGVDYEAMAAAVRCPQRVEIRPETAEKKYACLAFHRGDVNVIVGFRFPSSPAVMAVYWSSLLSHDEHRVEHHGGGGPQRTQPPKTRKALVTRLKASGCTLAPDPQSTSGAEVVTYKGQEVGKIGGERMNSAQVQDAYQRMRRRVSAIANRSE